MRFHFSLVFERRRSRDMASIAARRRHSLRALAARHAHAAWPSLSRRRWPSPAWRLCSSEAAVRSPSTSFARVQRMRQQTSHAATAAACRLSCGGGYRAVVVGISPTRTGATHAPLKHPLTPLEVRDVLLGPCVSGPVHLGDKGGSVWPLGIESHVILQRHPLTKPIS